VTFDAHKVVDRTSAVWQTLRRWPKIELHRHLEGSLRLDTLVDIAREYGIPLPAHNPDDLRPFVQMTGADQSSYIHFLSKFDVLRQFYRSLAVIERLTVETIVDAADDAVRYMELRFTPHALARQNEHTYAEIIRCVCAAAAQAEGQAPIRVRLIASVNRHESLAIAAEVLDAVLSVGDSRLVGLDLAGLEVGHPARHFAPILARARQAGLHLTVHAGEWDGPDSVREAVEVGAERIGHGVRAVEDPAVIELVRERNIALEVCPTSNLQSGVVDRVDRHPLITLSELDVPVTINTDDPLLCNITLTDELAVAHVGLGLPLSILKRHILTAARASFLPPDERAALVAEFEQALAALPA